MYLIVGGFLFWAIVALWAFALIVSVLSESAIAASTVTAICAAILAFAFHVPVLDYLPQTWLGWVGAVGGYVAIGVGWSLFKFYVTYKAAIRELRKSWTAYSANKNWNEYVDERAPRVSQMKDRIICWAAYWPVSALVYLLADLLRDVFNWLYERISGIYEAIARHVRDSFKDK